LILRRTARGRRADADQVDVDREALPRRCTAAKPVPGKSELPVGRIRGRYGTGHVLGETRQPYGAGAVRAVGEAVRQLAARAGIKAQRRAPDRLRIGDRRRIEVAPGVRIDRQCSVGLSGQRRAQGGIPALVVCSSEDGSVSKPAKENQPRSR